jgi:hypothetical protein
MFTHFLFLEIPQFLHCKIYSDLLKRDVILVGLPSDLQAGATADRAVLVHLPYPTLPKSYSANLASTSLFLNGSQDRL